MECSNISYPIANYDCREIPNQIKGIFPSLLKETVNRLCHYGIFPVKTSIGYTYMYDQNDKIIGTSIAMEYTLPKPNNELTKKELKELNKFPFLLHFSN